jgi:hypothetical protein
MVASRLVLLAVLLCCGTWGDASVAEDARIVIEPSADETRVPRAGDKALIRIGQAASIPLVYVPPGTFEMGSRGVSEARYGLTGLAFGMLLGTIATILRTCGLGRRYALRTGRIVFLGLWAGALPLIGYSAYRARLGYMYRYDVAAEPVHTVTITKGYFIGSTEITIAQFHAATGRERKDAEDPCLPMICLSWWDAHKFCQGLSAGLGRRVRLPTEAEWEYACRFRERPWPPEGPRNLLDRGWFEENSNGKIHPVASGRPNKLGAYDMLGNVTEWCADWFDPNYYHQSPAVDPPGPPRGACKVIRGGAHSMSVRYPPDTARCGAPPEWDNAAIGFRLLVELPQQGK